MGQIQLTAAHDPAGMSLERKLESIYHDREVLSVLRELARRGLKEGDRVRHGRTGEVGRVAVERGQPPRAVVQACGATSRDDGEPAQVIGSLDDLAWQADRPACR